MFTTIILIFLALSLGSDLIHEAASNVNLNRQASGSIFKITKAVALLPVMDSDRIIYHYIVFLLAARPIDLLISQSIH